MLLNDKPSNPSKMEKIQTAILMKCKANHPSNDGDAKRRVTFDSFIVFNYHVMTSRSSTDNDTTK